MTTPNLADKTEQIDALCRQARILPVVTIDNEAQILPMADALAAGGLRTLEITLRSEHGLTAIRTLRKERPDLCIGAGTILDPDMFRAAEDAGAQFIVSPGVTEQLLRFALDSHVPFLPGTGGASDIMLGYGMGYRRFKLFPAEASGGIPALKALGGPFNQVRFCPTGGVKPDNLKAYMAVPNVMCVGGSWMLDSAWTKAGDWARVTQVSAEALALLDS